MGTLRIELTKKTANTKKAKPWFPKNGYKFEAVDERRLEPFARFARFLEELLSGLGSWMDLLSLVVSLLLVLRPGAPFVASLFLVASGS